MTYHGKHVMMDCVYNPKDKEPSFLMNHIFDLIDYSIKMNSNMKIIHKFKHLFHPPDQAGFSIIYSLDSSHASCHCYSDKGLLSFDVYTCGDNSPSDIMIEIYTKLKNGILPSIKTTSLSELKRFFMEQD